MSDRNINLYNTEDEKQRYAYSMLPTHLLVKGLNEGKNLVKKMTKDLPKKLYKQKIHFAHIFNELATIQTYPHNIDMHDIHLEPGELSLHPYESLLRTLGAESAIELLRHAKIVDSCLNQTLSNQIIVELKTYLSKSFNYDNNELNINMPAEEFYLHLVLSFIAHLDACIHHAVYSKDIAPISLGWLFMHKLHPDKWKYDSKCKKYSLTNKNDSPFTCTSRSFIDFLRTVFYWQIYGDMPVSLYGIDSQIVQKEFDRTHFKPEGFIRRKRQGKWISLEDVFWLVGIQESKSNDSNQVLASWQVSMTKYIKTEKVDNLSELPPSAEGIIWFIYAFFQNIYEQTDKINKANKEQNCVIYDDYYDLWESITDHYESSVSEEIKCARIDWPSYLTKQATRTERMT